MSDEHEFQLEGDRRPLFSDVRNVGGLRAWARMNAENEVSRTGRLRSALVYVMEGSSEHMPVGKAEDIGKETILAALFQDLTRREGVVRAFREGERLVEIAGRSRRAAVVGNCRRGPHAPVHAAVRGAVAQGGGADGRPPGSAAPPTRAPRPPRTSRFESSARQRAGSPMFPETPGISSDKTADDLHARVSAKSMCLTLRVPVSPNLEQATDRTNVRLHRIASSNGILRDPSL